MKYLFAILTFIFLSISSINAQWTKVPIPSNSLIYNYFAVADKLIINDEFGAALSTNYGENWSRSPIEYNFLAVLESDNKIYAICDIPTSLHKKGLLISTDNAENWDTITTFVIPGAIRMVKTGQYFYFLSIDYYTSKMHVFNTSNNQLIELGIFESNYPHLRYTYGIKSIGSNIFLASDWGLIRYKNGGTQVDTLSKSRFTMLSVKGDTLYSQSDSFRLSYSLNLGANWIQIPDNANYSNAIYQKLYFKNNRSFLVTRSSQLGPFVDNYTRLWELNEDLTQGSVIFSLDGDFDFIGDFMILNDSSLMLSTIYHGLVKLKKGEQTWQKVYTGLGKGDYGIRGVDDILLGDQFISIDTGRTWIAPMVGNTLKAPLGSIEKLDSFYYAVFYNQGLWKSKDLKNWEFIEIGVNQVSSIGNYLIKGNIDNIFQYSLNGIDWTPAPNYQGSGFSNSEDGVYFSADYDATHNSSSLKFSSDLGNTWHLCNSDFQQSPNDGIGEVSISGPNIYLTTNDYSNPDVFRYLYASHDYGYNWKKMSINSYPFDNQAFLCSGRLWFDAEGEYIHVTANDGEVVSEIKHDTFASPLKYIFIAHNKLWAETYNGLWTININDLNLNVYKGTVFHDINLNGMQDISEKGIPNVRVRVSNQDWQVVSDSLGHYEITPLLINDSISVLKPILYCNIAPSTIYADANNYNNNNFAIQIEPNKTDVSISAANTQIFRPGFETNVIVSVKNEGSNLLNNVQMVLTDYGNQNKIEFLSASPTPNQINGDTLIWSNISIDLFQQKDILITFKTNANANLGDTVFLAFSAIINNDLNLIDNIISIREKIIGSFDPNDKKVNPKFVSPIETSNTDLFYTIRFQNTGNYPADFVTILDTLSTELDITTLSVLSASHPFTWLIQEGRVLVFKFKPINLPDSTTNEVGSHGFVQFKIKAKSDLNLGTIINNRAAIYFDYNPPVITKYSKMYISDTETKISNIISEKKLKISPNPANNYVNLEKEDENSGILEIYSTNGRLYISQNTNNKSVKISISSFPFGLYFVKWKCGNVQFQAKFVK
jgi:uncharacterized repeat protein (TIGR01451 family)